MKKGKMVGRRKHGGNMNTKKVRSEVRKERWKEIRSEGRKAEEEDMRKERRML